MDSVNAPMKPNDLAIDLTPESVLQQEEGNEKEKSIRGAADKGL